MNQDNEWAWLAQVTPRAAERERFNVTAATLRRREGTHLGMLTGPRDEDVRIIRAKIRERERAALEREHAEKRAELHGEVRELRLALERERHDRARDEAWRKKLTTMGRLPGGPSALEIA